MNKNTKRLSKGFWHKFIPNSTKLISPQNIKLEIWDLNTKKIIDKWDPEISCIRNCAFNKSGNKFILSGGCCGNESEFKIYNTVTFELLNKFWFPEQVGNAVFNVDDDFFVFGTWEGNIYKVKINDKIILDETKTKIGTKTFKDYVVSPKSKNKLLHIENSMIKFCETDMDNENIFFVVSPKSLSRTTDLNLLSDYVLVYNLKDNSTSEIKLPIEKNRYQIAGLKYYNRKLAIMTTVYGGKENDNVFHYANLFIYDLEEERLHIIKEDFKIRDVFSEAQSLSWNAEGKLAFISLNEVIITDTKNNFEETRITIDRPTSVEFSEDGKLLAVGGKKAILYKMT